MKVTIQRGSKDYYTMFGLVKDPEMQHQRSKKKRKVSISQLKKKKLKKRLNYILHPLTLVQFQFSLLSFDRFNLVLKVCFRFKNLLRWDHFPLAV
jgi:hypothetical protein